MPEVSKFNGRIGIAEDPKGGQGQGPKPTIIPEMPEVGRDQWKNWRTGKL